MNSNYTNTYLYKIESAFIASKFQIDDLLNFVKEEPIDIEKYINIICDDLLDINYELFELQLRLRALRDKLNESEIQ